MISTKVFDAKRNSLGQEKIESWCDYYAGYSARFAKSIIHSANLSSDSVILDPWNGSGTTTLAATELGFQSIGIDINPVAVLIAKSKLIRYDDASQLSGLAFEICSKIKKKTFNATNQPDPLDIWLERKIVLQYRFIEQQILKNVATNHEKITLTPQSGKISCIAYFLIYALIRAAKTYASIKPSSNPTWIRNDEIQDSCTHDFPKMWLSFIQSMVEDIPKSTNGRLFDSQIQIGNSKNLPVKDNSIDFILTSPPYCTRIDYAISTSFELCALSFDISHESFKEFRKKIMGAPLVRDKIVKKPKATWSKSIKEVLEKIKKHPSKASNSYYYKTYWDYFDDLEKSIIEIARVLKVNGKAYLVIQGSFYKEIYVDLPFLYQEMFKSLGFNANIFSENVLSRSLSQININSSQYRQLNEMQKESILCIERKL